LGNLLHLRQDHGGGEQGKGLDAVVLRPERARLQTGLVEVRIARLGVVEVLAANALGYPDGQQIDQNGAQKAQLGDGHAGLRT
jgi:hypothetical protein